MNKKNITPWLFALPAILMFLTVVVIPLFCTLVFSLVSWNGVAPMQFIGIKNYTKMINDRTLVSSFFHNIKFSLLSSIIQFTVGLILAILLSSVHSFKNVLKVIYFVPCIVATVAVAQIFMKLLALEPLGIFNVILEYFHITPKSWLGESKTALTALSCVDAYKYCALYMVIFYSGFMSISQEIVDAAYIDGCGWFRAFRYVKLPMIRSVTGLVIVLLVNGTLKAFEMPYVLTGGKPGTSTELVATYMYKTAFLTMQYGYASAIAVFLLVECMVAVLTVKKLTSNMDVE